MTGVSPTIHVKMSIDEGSLETQHVVPKDEWFLLFVNYLNGTLETHVGNTVSMASLDDVVPRSSPILYTESFSKLEVGGMGLSFAIGDLQVFNQLLTSGQIGSLKSYYEDNHCKCSVRGDQIDLTNPKSLQNHTFGELIIQKLLLRAN